MASCRFPPWPILCRVLSRALGWLTSLIAIVVLSFLASQWSDLSGAAVSGILGATVSLITDSWQIVALTSGGSDFPILSPTRATFHDLVSLCVCVGGGVLIRLAKLQETDEIDAGEPLADSSPVRPYYSRQAMLMACMWTLASVM
ncbi:hypothetical protein DCS_03364 [Drechmeria coniospora]|uniref:Uncharacterized protein n=1 Tax=Drechmeria coniospora TaxID=98403 RepID=A0A151GH05_DRECN|nr:hypothetical protein DCS_03364 [Drechmeria coniospora]KYK56364.1 hypothetical protein DCS_03364 [Drechmeria coniospora]ODA76814.1 hypothetical protein RJ55_07330 [Drechmeria coniospora]